MDGTNKSGADDASTKGMQRFHGREDFKFPCRVSMRRAVVAWPAEVSLAFAGVF
jgi:hypothetical protein